MTKVVLRRVNLSALSSDSSITKLRIRKVLNRIDHSFNHQVVTLIGIEPILMYDCYSIQPHEPRPASLEI